MKVKQTCPICGQKHELEVDAQRLHLWMSGELLIQEALPDLNPVEREFVKLGYCPECQALLFGTKYTSEKIRPAVA